MKILSKIYSLLPKNLQEKIKFFKYYFYFDKNRYKQKNYFTGTPEKTIIVLGMHRSGTSIVGKILNSLGVDMGKYLLEPSYDNEKGFYENRNFVAINNHLLAKAGGMWHSPPKRNSLKKLKNKSSILHQIKKVLLRNQKKIWGWKDPRTSLTLPLFLEHLKNPFIIVCSRNHLSIINSLEKRGGFSKKKASDLVKKYNININKTLEENPSLPFLKIKFEDIIRNEKKEIKRIKNFLKIKKEIKNVIVERELVHN